MKITVTDKFHQQIIISTEDIISHRPLGTDGGNTSLDMGGGHQMVLRNSYKEFLLMFSEASGEVADEPEDDADGDDSGSDDTPEDDGESQDDGGDEGESDSDIDSDGDSE